jgi:hypothetical protein
MLRRILLILFATLALNTLIALGMVVFGTARSFAISFVQSQAIGLTIAGLCWAVRVARRRRPHRGIEHAGRDRGPGCPGGQCPGRCGWLASPGVPVLPSTTTQCAHWQGGAQ